MSIRLSPRTCEVLTAVIQGKTDKEISSRLGISVHTVRTYLRKLYTTTGACNRAALVAWYFTDGPGSRGATIGTNEKASTRLA